MDIHAYQPLALKTVTWLGAEYDRNHGVLGIASEVGEIVDSIYQSLWEKLPYDRVNLMEEVGDTFWYLNLLVFSADLDWSNVLRQVDKLFNIHVPLLCMGMSVCTGRIADVVKRNVIYGKEINKDKLEEDIVELIVGLMFILDMVDVTLEQALDANIAKLAKRYPEGTFSADRAINRDTAAEQEVLRQAAA